MDHVKMNESIPPTFLQYASDILADTTSGLSGPNIVKEMSAFAVEYDVAIPHPTYPFDAPNKRAALYENLSAFAGPQQYAIIKSLCDHRSLTHNSHAAKRKELKIRLITRYQHLSSPDTPVGINETLLEETKHWLSAFPQSLSLYNEALEKFEHGLFFRNLLDDLRLALERLLRAILGNDKSLENQNKEIGSFLKIRGGSKELANMFVKLIDYYATYQNTYVKHNDAVLEGEIEFIFELTSSFMKHLSKLSDV